MRLLLDTQLLLRMAGLPGRLSDRAREMMEAAENTIFFSSVNIWETAIKRALNHPDFATEPGYLRDRLHEHGFTEIAMTSDHAIAVRALPLIHRDPFDRILIAQAALEHLTLLTTDRSIARYPGDILAV